MAAVRKVPMTQKELKEIFEYDEKTGNLVWRRGRSAGRVAGSRQPFGYIYIHLHGENYRAHRLVYKMLYDEEPSRIVHIDGARYNNTAENLRGVDNSSSTKGEKVTVSKTTPTTQRELKEPIVSKVACDESVDNNIKAETMNVFIFNNTSDSTAEKLLRKMGIYSVKKPSPSDKN